MPVNAAAAGGQAAQGSSEDDGRNLHELLENALGMAERLREGDYTAESYQALRDAIEQAEALLNAPEASREEVEDAILALENAMGALAEAPQDAVVPEAGADAEAQVTPVHTGNGMPLALWIVIVLAVVLGIGSVVYVRVRDRKDFL